MDIHELLNRLHEAKRAAGNRPVEVEFIPSRSMAPGQAEVTYIPATGHISSELTTPRIRIEFNA